MSCSVELSMKKFNNLGARYMWSKCSLYKRRVCVCGGGGGGEYNGPNFEL